MPKTKKKTAVKKKAAQKSAPSVKIYTTPACPWCKKTKEFFRDNNVKYREINVAANEQARNKMFDKSHQTGVPVIDINGEIIVGYNTGALKKALHGNK